MNDLNLLGILDSIKYCHYLNYKSTIFNGLCSSIPMKENESESEYIARVSNLANQVAKNLDTPFIPQTETDNGLDILKQELEKSKQ